jgi:hypothetical protein
MGRKQILIFTIGMRDLMKVYQNSSGWLIREKVVKKDLSDNNFSHLPLRQDPTMEEQAVWGKGLDKPPIQGMNFPILQKAFSYIHQECKLQTIDKLVLVTTSRLFLMEQLEKFKTWLFNHIADCADCEDKITYIERLQELIRSDLSMPFAELIRDKLKTDRIAGIEIREVIILPMGKYGYFHELLEYHDGDTITWDLLETADINKSSFFDREFATAIRPYALELENADVYFSLYASGMPIMQKSIEYVLQNTIVLSQYHPIFISECRTYMMEQPVLRNLLELNRMMHRYIVGLDWDGANHCYNEIMNIDIKYFPREAQMQFKECHQKVIQAQKSKRNWFGNFFVLIMKALYNHDYNNAIIWIKCMEESAWEAIITLLCKKYNWKVVEKQLYDGRMSKSIIVKNNEDIGYFFRSIKPYIPEESKPLVTLYTRNFHTGEWESNLSKAYKDLRDKRNKLMHNGIPVYENRQIKNEILTFLKIDANQLDEAITNLEKNQWDLLTHFEKELLQSNMFFSSIKEISGIRKPDWLPIERQVIPDYVKAIHAL